MTSKKSNFGMESLDGACKRGNTHAVRKLLRSAEKANASFHKILYRKLTDGRTILHQACAHGHVGTIRYLLDKFKEKGVLKKGRRRPLAHEVTIDDIISITTDDGYNMIHLAAANGRDMTVSYLLNLSESAGTDIKRWLTKETGRKQNLLEMLVVEGALHTLEHITEYYRERGIHLINTFHNINSQGRNYIHSAAALGRTDVIRFIVQLSKDYYNQTTGKTMSPYELFSIGYIGKLKPGSVAVAELVRAASYIANPVDLKKSLSWQDASQRDPLKLALQGQHSDTAVFLTKCFKEQGLPVPNIFINPNPSPNEIFHTLELNQLGDRLLVSGSEDLTVPITNNGNPAGTLRFVFHAKD